MEDPDYSASSIAFYHRHVREFAAAHQSRPTDAMIQYLFFSAVSITHVDPQVAVDLLETILKDLRQEITDDVHSVAITKAQEELASSYQIRQQYGRRH